MMMLHSKQEFSIKQIASSYPLFMYYTTHICTILHCALIYHVKTVYIPHDTYAMVYNIREDLYNILR